MPHRSIDGISRPIKLGTRYAFGDIVDEHSLRPAIVARASRAPGPRNIGATNISFSCNYSPIGTQQ